MFLGTYSAIFSSNHRVAVPSQFRKGLGDTLILTKWYEGCLILVSKEYWSALWQRLTGGEEMIITSIRDTERFILSGAFEILPDDQGRIVVPERLAEYAGFGEKVMFLGVGDRVEIWDEAKWGEKEKLLVKEAPELIDKLANERRKVSRTGSS